MSPLTANSTSTSSSDHEEPGMQATGADMLQLATAGYSWEAAAGTYEETANWSWSSPLGWS